MKVFKGIIITLSVLLLVAGGIMLGIAIKNKSFSSPVNTVENNYEITESFTNIDININTAELTIEKSSNDKTTVKCVEQEKLYHKVEVENNTLKIKAVDEREWTEKWFNIGKMEIVVFLSSSEFNDLLIKNSTGDVLLEEGLSFSNVTIDQSTGDITIKSTINGDVNIDVSTGDVKMLNSNPKSLNIETSTGRTNLKNVNVSGDIKIKSDTGKVELEGVTSKNLEIDVDTSKVFLTSTVVEEKMNIKATTGDVKFDKSDAGSIKVKTTTGDVKGTLLTPKSFRTHTSTGKDNTPNTTGGECNIETTTGDIIIEIVE